MSQSWLTDFEYGSIDADVLAKELREVLGESGVVRVTGFPVAARELTEFLGRLGTPLGYYGDDAGTHPEHKAIWRVTYDRRASLRGEVHALDGPLSLHSSQSLLEPRPQYFCMLMADPGWQDQESGMNGESLLVPWRRALELLSEDRPGEYERMLEVLLSPLPFPDGKSRSVAYQIEPQRGSNDYGIRLKSDLLAHLRTVAPSWWATEIVDHLAQAGQRAANRVQLAAGDLVVVDNDRWGHGRESVIGRRPNNQGLWDVNPRELWSLTLA